MNKIIRDIIGIGKSKKKLRGNREGLDPKNSDASLNEMHANMLVDIDDDSEDIVYKEIAELSKNGYNLLKEDLLDDSIFCFNKILDLDPGNNYALVGLGDVQRKRGDFREAAKYYNTCLNNQPENNYALFGLADCYKLSRQYSKAITIWERYLQFDSKNINVLTRVADSYRKIKDFRSSKSYYLRVLDMEESNPYALIGLGSLHYDFREYEAALFYWEKILEHDNENVDIRVLTSLGNCHRKMRSYESGIKYFEMAINLEPNNFYALFGLADCYRGMEEHAESLIFWERILKRDPNNKVILTRIGDAYRNLKNFDKAEKYYQDAIDIAHDSYAVLGLALINMKKENFEEALVGLKSLQKADNKNFRVYLDIAECYLALNHKSKAIETLTDFQHLGFHNVEITKMLERLQSV